MSHLSEDQLDQIIDTERLREQAPLNEWRTIAARAREEGLIRESSSRRIWGSSQPWLQAAAAVVLLLGGIAIGRTTMAIPSGAESGMTNVVARAPSQTAPVSGTGTESS